MPGFTVSEYTEIPDLILMIGGLALGVFILLYFTKRRCPTMLPRFKIIKIPKQMKESKIQAMCSYHDPNIEEQAVAKTYPQLNASGQDGSAVDSTK